MKLTIVKSKEIKKAGKLSALEVIPIDDETGCMESDIDNAKRKLIEVGFNKGVEWLKKRIERTMGVLDDEESFN